MPSSEPDHDAVAEAADAVRRLITHVRRTTADPELLRRVAREANTLADALAPHDYEGPFQQRKLVLLDDEDGRQPPESGDVSEYFPYSPVVGPRNPIAPKIDFELVDREFHATHVFEPQYNGPPGSVHGGIVALVFDELLGALGAMLEIGGFTGTLKVVYRSLTPLHRPVRMRSWVDGTEGVKTFIKGTMHTTDADGTERLCAEAEGIFVRPKTSVFEHADLWDTRVPSCPEELQRQVKQ